MKSQGNDRFRHVDLQDSRPPFLGEEPSFAAGVIPWIAQRIRPMRKGRRKPLGGVAADNQMGVGTIVE
jgi:hypothetical protein